MTVQELANRLDLKVKTLPDPEREVTGAYVGDLLSWVMGRANAGDAWITIMSNANTVAVSSLADTACVILAEGVEPDEGVSTLAEAKGVNILGSEKTSYGIAAGLAKLLS